MVCLYVSLCVWMMMRIQRCLCGVSGPDSGAAALPPDVKDDL